MIPYNLRGELAMLKFVAFGLIVLAAAGCNGASPGAPAPSETAVVFPTPPRPPPRPGDESSSDSAIYLSLGDSLQYGCCHPQDAWRSAHPAFAEFLSEHLGRPVEWVTLAGNDTTSEFMEGIPGEGPSQIERAVATLEEYRRQGRDVVVITLSIGGNDLLALRPICQGRGGGDVTCLEAFTQILQRYAEQLALIYERIHAAKDPDTPILHLNVYDPMDCGRPRDNISSSALGVGILNTRIPGPAPQGDVFLADIHGRFLGKACEYIRDVDPTYEGYAAMAEELKETYESLPPAFSQPPGD